MADDAKVAWAVVATSVYFASLFVCLWHALRDLSWTAWRRSADSPDVPAKGPRRSAPSGFGRRVQIAARNISIVTFALGSAIAAWYHITVFMIDDRAAYSTTLEWIADSSWFVKAYENVTATPQQWFWSSQLLQGVGTLVVFTFVEGFRCAGTRPLSSFWLGCAAAISLAFPLFVGSVANTPRDVYQRRFLVPFRWYLPAGVIVSSIATTLLPLVESDAYGPVLAAVHIGLLAPLALAQFFKESVGPDSSQVAEAKTPESRRNRLIGHSVACTWIVATYGILAGLGLAAQLHNVLAVLESFGGLRASATAILGASCANSCQCSITGDVVLTTLFVCACMLCFYSRLSLPSRLLCVVLTPFLSFAATFPAFLAVRELREYRVRLGNMVTDSGAGREPKPEISAALKAPSISKAKATDDERTGGTKED